MRKDKCFLPVMGLNRGLELLRMRGSAKNLKADIIIVVVERISAKLENLISLVDVCHVIGNRVYI